MRRMIAVVFTLFFLSLVSRAQQPAIGFCTLDQTLDFKTAKTGDKISLHLARNLVVDGKTLMARGTPLSATVVDAKDGTVSLVLEKATPTSGQDVPLIGIIAAVAAPPDGLSGDAIYGMNASREPTQRTGNLGGSNGPTSSAGSSAAVQTAQIEAANGPKSNLQENSSGAIGIDGLKLNWVLDKRPATTVLTAKKKNFKLQRGTEVLLRMVPPQV